VTSLAAIAPSPSTRFDIPVDREASVPPELRGVARDGVRLLVATPTGLTHHRFRDLPDMLDAGDLMVVNTSATVPAALTACRADGVGATVHVSTWLDSSAWVVEIRRQDNAGPDLTLVEGESLRLPGEVTLTLVRRHPDPAAATSRLWVAEVAPKSELVPYLQKHGRPVVYRHLAEGLPLSAHQTVYADQPGSAEMPSAGRPFTSELLARLMVAGVAVAPLVLHAGVSSPEFQEPPAPERYIVPASTARLVATARRARKRVVAVGTTVVRALETDAENGGTGGSGWTDLVLGPGRPVRVVNGLVTGLHMPESSHLLLLEAVAGAQLVEAAYTAAIDRGYLWHEFGDSMLFLP
jgi:S-adenosylmethionine:tRNA ribosyltransferase-isomerase